MRMESIVGKPWYRVFEASIVVLFIFLIIYIDSGDFLVSGLITVQSIFLIGYLEYLFRTPWPRLILPLSMASLTYLAAKMMKGTIMYSLYPWVVMIYGIAVFILYHAITRMLGIFLWERKARYRVISDDVMIDMFLFLVAVSTDAFVLLINHSVRPLAVGILLFLMYTVWFIAPFIVKDHILIVLLKARPRIEGYAHPREPEVEKLHFSLSSMIVLSSMTIPLLFAYTSPVLIKRAFVPLVLLGVYELIVIALFITAYITVLHGALLESYAGDRRLDIEHYNVFDAWRDIAWYMNRSAGYYLKMKYLSALYMLFQALEILSLRIGDKSIYFGPIYDLLNEGLEELKKNKLASKYAVWKVINDTLREFQPDKVYIVEPNWLPIEGSGFEEQLRRAMGSVVNLYCKFHEVPREARREARDMLLHARDKLIALYAKARRSVKPYVQELIEYINLLLEKDEVKPEDLEKILIKQPLTINMLRNYLVHGQLFKNALVYKNNRTKADRLMSLPGTLYTLYVLILLSSLKRAPQLLGGKD